MGIAYSEHDAPPVSGGGGGSVATDAIWTAKGDLALGTGSATAAALNVSTSPGAAVVADPGATNKVAWLNPFDLECAGRGSSGSLASTYDRSPYSASSSAGAPTSGQLGLNRIMLPKGMLITNITHWTGATALASGTHQWFSLYDVNLNLLGVTGDDTSTAWAANTAKTLALATPYTTTYTGWYYLGRLVTAGTMPNFETTTSAGLLITGSRTALPRAGGNSTSSLTTPASAPNPAGAITCTGQFNYAEVS